MWSVVVSRLHPFLVISIPRILVLQYASHTFRVDYIPSRIPCGLYTIPRIQYACHTHLKPYSRFWYEDIIPMGTVWRSLQSGKNFIPYFLLCAAGFVHIWVVHVLAAGIVHNILAAGLVHIWVPHVLAASIVAVHIWVVHVLAAGIVAAGLVYIWVVHVLAACIVHNILAAGLSTFG